MENKRKGGKREEPNPQEHDEQLFALRPCVDEKDCRAPGPVSEVQANGMGQAGEGFVYFIESSDGRSVKIGHATNVAKRLMALRTGCPDFKALGYIQGDRRREMEIHSQLGSYRWHGEWFTNTQEVREFISALGLIPITVEPPRVPTIIPPDVLARPISPQSKLKIAWGRLGRCKACGKPKHPTSSSYCQDHMLRWRESTRIARGSVRRYFNSSSYKVERADSITQSSLFDNE